MRRAAAILALGLAACAEADPGAGGLGAAPSPSFEVVERGTEPAGPTSEPSLVLVRDRTQAEVAAAEAPADGAAELIRSWDDDRALLVVYGGTVPDGGVSVRVDDVSVDQGGRHVTVTASLESEDPAIQVVSNAWAAVALESALVDRAETCALVLDDREIPDAACSPAVPYASK